MDWREFRFDYRLQPGDLTSDLIRIEASKEAALNLVLPPDWKTQLDRLNRVRAVHGTTALEGNPLSEAEVQQQMDLLAGDPAQSPNPSAEQRQVRNAGVAQQPVVKVGVSGIDTTALLLYTGWHVDGNNA